MTSEQVRREGGSITSLLIPHTGKCFDAFHTHPYSVWLARVSQDHYGLVPHTFRGSLNQCPHIIYENTYVFFKDENCKSS